MNDIGYRIFGVAGRDFKFVDSNLANHSYITVVVQTVVADSI